MNIREVTDKELFLETLPLLNLLMTESNYKAVTEEQGWRGFEKAVQSGYREFCSTDKENRVVAVIGLRAFYDPLETDVGFEINNLIVDPDLRGQGIGTKLFEFAAETAKKEGANWIRLMVFPTNEKAIRFYNKHEFKHLANLMMWEKET